MNVFLNCVLTINVIVLTLKSCLNSLSNTNLVLDFAPICITLVAKCITIVCTTVVEGLYVCITLHLF